MVINRFREARKAANKTQKDAARALGVSLDTIWRLESGQRKPKTDEVQKLADLYCVNYSYLVPTLQTTEDSTDVQEDINATPFFDATSSRGDTLRIPILSREKSACCGSGFPNSNEIYADINDYLDMPSALVGIVSADAGLRPYFMYADGDSMIKAGIMDGFLVLVNPAEPVYDGDSALVEYGIDRNIAIKRVYWLADGAVKIASADDSGWARTFTREEINEEKIFHIIGKIMFAGVRPKRG